MSDVQTIYEVITRLTVEDKATASLERVGRTAQGVSRTIGGLGLGLSSLTRHLTAAAIGFGAFRTGEAILGRLNEQMNRTNQLAGQFNLAFKFDADPAKQFAASMRESRTLVNQIIGDAQKLPGEAKDFFGVAALISGPAFRARGGAAGVRRMTSEIALSAPFAGVSPQVGGYEVLEMLQGRANARNPMFAMLSGAGLLPNASQFNAMALADRFKATDTAMTRLTGNPFFRDRVISTLDTQLGNLRDNLVGPMGIGGRLLGGENYPALISGLTSLNESLATNTPAIVGFLRALGDGVAALWDTTGGLAGRALGKLGIDGDFVRESGTRYNVNASTWGAMDKVYGPLGSQVFGLNRPIPQYLMALEERSIRSPGAFPPGELDEGLTRAGTSVGSLAKKLGVAAVRLPDAMVRSVINQSLLSVRAEGEKNRNAALNHPSDTVNQTFNIKIDLKTDTSPEAIALKFEKAMEMMARKPMRPKRGMPWLHPGPGVGP